jgi:ribosomal protein L37AE/L43A
MWRRIEMDKEPVEKMHMSVQDILDAAKCLDSTTILVVEGALKGYDQARGRRYGLTRAVEMTNKLLLQPALVESFDLFGVNCSLKRSLERHDKLVKDMLASMTPCPKCGHPNVKLLVDDVTSCNKCHHKTNVWQYYPIWVKDNPWPKD